ncbi:hypothetical protein OH77DRAFT_187381 [Trametes cingulata]|nr:hypothetical protein OH77DRAFT_187381 [Trametes cingulata]
MHDLQSIWIKGQMWDQVTLSYLGSLPSLTALALENGWSHVSYLPRAECVGRPFASLQHLLVSIAHSEGLSVLAHIDPIALETVTIYWEYLFAYTDASGIVIQQYLEECAHFGQLKHFAAVLDPAMEKRIGDKSLPPGHQHRLRGFARSNEYLRPVLALTSLITLEIVIDVVFQLNNRFLRELAQKLPHLECLILTPSSRTEYFIDEVPSILDDDDDYDEDNPELPDYLPTLDGLLLLVKGCPKLATLKLAVRSAFSPDVRDLKVRQKGGPHTMELWATPLDPEIPDRVFAEFFARAFPALRDFQVALPSYSGPASAVYEKMTPDAARSRWSTFLEDLNGSRGGDFRGQLIEQQTRL